MKTVTAGLVAMLLCSSGQAQVQAHTATPQETKALESGNAAALGDVEMKSPMLLEIPLKVTDGPARKLPPRIQAVPKRPGWLNAGKAPTWSTLETARFTCDRARVPGLFLYVAKPKKDPVEIEVSGMFTSGWYRQDLDVTMSIVYPDGKERLRRFWDDESVGEGGSNLFAGHSKFLIMSVKIPQAEWAKWVSGELVPTLRVLVEIQGDGHDSDE
ncbi:MAG: hypothetical protein ABI639_17485 [Thermoanaerobaculia bacterium]